MLHLFLLLIFVLPLVNTDMHSNQLRKFVLTQLEKMGKNKGRKMKIVSLIS